MQVRLGTLTLLLVLAMATSGTTQDKRRDEGKKPLVLASQGSFFVGGETKSLPAAGPPGGRGFGGGDITINQMYVQYQIPPNGDRHVPVVMVHGCCLILTWIDNHVEGKKGSRRKL